MMPGWIELHRQITENIYWFSKRFTKAQAWVTSWCTAGWIDFDLRNCYLHKWEE